MSRYKQSRYVTAFEGKAADSRSYADAQALIEWFNLGEQNLKRHQQKAARAVEILREINVRATEGKPWQDLSRELSAIATPLNHLRWRFMKNRAGRWYLDQKDSGDTNYGLFLIARLSGHGLDWVRRCRCGKWFTGYTSRSRFCSPECKKAADSAERKTAEGREARRRYMQKYRAWRKKRQAKGRVKP